MKTDTDTLKALAAELRTKQGGSLATIRSLMEDAAATLTAIADQSAEQIKPSEATVQQDAPVAGDVVTAAEIAAIRDMGFNPDTPPGAAVHTLLRALYECQAELQAEREKTAAWQPLVEASFGAGHCNFCGWDQYAKHPSEHDDCPVPAALEVLNN